MLKHSSIPIKQRNYQSTVKIFIRDLEKSRDGGDRVLNEYSHVLEGRKIQYMVFNENGQNHLSNGWTYYLKRRRME